MSGRGIVVVGAGEAGVRAAMALREQGFAGRIRLIGAERHAPYERPPLSKACLADEPEARLPVIGEAARLAEHGIEHRPATTVTAIDRQAHALATSDGDTVGYDRLCLAVGASARRLGVPGSEAALYLRTFDEAMLLRSQLRRGARIAIIGGGFIGLEIAAGARQRGSTVSVIEAAPRLLMRGVPAAIAAAIGDRHRREGAEILTGTAVAAIAPGAVHLAGGRTIAADVVVAGIGAVPETALAAAAGLAIDNGIAVDERLATSDPDIFAIGDCASFPHPLYGGRRIRLEAWRNAQDQGAFVAASLLGARAAYRAVPWFWSDQYDLHLQIAGLADAGSATVVRDLGEGAFVHFHLAEDGRLVAASGLGRLGLVAKEVRLAEMLIARGARPDPASLASSKFKLKALLAA
jgi:3-phenylpropionate/trans-cinnamate dioxygenase ferredoxin reductase subunit